MREIKKGDEILARHILSDDMREGLSFFSQDAEFIQVGSWCYGQGKELLAHMHNQVPRTISKTYEVLYVISGSIEAYIYDLEENLVEIVCVRQSEILILLECGHGYKVLEEDTRVLEVKNGPYLGPEIDRRRI